MSIRNTNFDRTPIAPSLITIFTFEDESGTPPEPALPRAKHCAPVTAQHATVAGSNEGPKNKTT
jgi:hypothetical protein